MRESRLCAGTSFPFSLFFFIYSFIDCCYFYVYVEEKRLAVVPFFFLHCRKIIILHHISIRVSFSSPSLSRVSNNRLAKGFRSMIFILLAFDGVLSLRNLCCSFAIDVGENERKSSDNMHKIFAIFTR